MPSLSLLTFSVAMSSGLGSEEARLVGPEGSNASSVSSAAAAAAAVLGLGAHDSEAKGAAGGVSSALWGASVEAVCFFVSLAAVRVISARWSRASASKSRQASCTAGSKRAVSAYASNMEAMTSSGEPLVVLKAWRQERNNGPVPAETLKAVAQALADADADHLVEELVAHLQKHSRVLARHNTVHMLLDATAQAGRPDLAEDLASAMEQRLGMATDVRGKEILLGAFASTGDEKKVGHLLADLGTEATARAYSLIIKGLLKSSKVSAATAYLLEMQERGQEVPQRAVVELCKAAISRGSVPETLEKLADRVQLPADSVPPLLSDCAAREDFETARQVERLVRERNLPFTHASFESLLKLHAKADDCYGVQLFEEMQQRGFHASEGLCGCVLAKCAESQNLRLAEHVVAHLRSRSAMTLSTYKTLMKVYACGGQYEKACDLYEELQKENIEPDAVMYGCLVKFAVKCGRTALSRSLFEKAGGGYVQNYMWLIRSAGQDGNVKRALELLQQLEAQQPQGLDIMVYNCALDACVINGEMERAQELLGEMQKSFSLNLITYNTLMKGHCARGDYQKAFRVFRNMEEAGIVPDSASFNCLISTAVTAGNMQQVWSLLAEMDRRSVRVDQYTVSILMKASRKCSDPRDADRALSVLDRAGVHVCQDEVLFNTVLDACIHRRQKARLAKAIETYGEAKGMKPSVRTYGLLIKACSILKMPQRCWELWSEMVDHRKLTPNDITLSCMLDALIEARHIEEALALFQEWKPKVAYNTVIYSTLIKGFASAGDAERAMQAYRDMRAEGVQMNLVAYTALIDSQARSGNVEQASKLLRCMEEDGCQPNTITYSNIVKGYCISGDLGEALRMFQEMLDRGLAADTVIFNTLLDGCVRHSHFELADRLLADMGKYHVHPSNFTVSIVVKMWGKRRDLDKAFEAVRSSLREPNKLNVDPLVGACLVGACIHNRSIDRALEAFEEIKGWGRSDCPDVNTYGSLICGLARHGRCQQAVDLTDEATSLPGAGREPLGREPMRQLFKALAVHGRAKDLGLPLAARLRQRGVQVEHRWLAGN